MKGLGIAALLVLAGCSATDRGAPALASDAFEEVSERTGLVFSHFNGATGEYYLPEIMGSGVGLFDYDGDGDLDVYFSQGDFIDAGRSMRDATFPMPEGWRAGGRLFRNELVPGGSLRFTDVTEPSGLATRFHGMGVAVGDYDNNGTLDLVATGVGQAALWKNRGDGTFEDVSSAAGIVDRDLSTSAAFLDYDRDGWPRTPCR